MAVGLDPLIGFMHGNRHNKMPLVSDLMESMRPAGAQKVAAFALSQTFCPGDFTINSSGGCRINPQMAKVIANIISGTKAHHNVRAFIWAL
jgi:CRISP-associated protein Cas1